MDNRLLLTQTCNHCFQVLCFIHERRLLPKLVGAQIKIDMINTEHEFGVAVMTEAVEWLANNVDREVYEDQASVSPILVRRSIDGIEDIIVGSEDIISYLSKL